MSDLHNLSVKALATLLQTKEVSAVEVATRFLARMGGNPHNAFLDIDSEVTLAQARASDAKLADGTTGRARRPGRFAGSDRVDWARWPRRDAGAA